MTPLMMGTAARTLRDLYAALHIDDYVARSIGASPIVGAGRRLTR